MDASQNAFFMYATIGAMSSSAINGSGNSRTTLMKKRERLIVRHDLLERLRAMIMEGTARCG